METRNPFAYDTEVYLWVIVLASIAGIVRFINTCIPSKEFHYIVLVRDLFAGVLAGLMAFWICEYFDLIGPFSNVAVAIAGMMGINGIEEIKGIVLTVLRVYTTNHKDTK